MGPTSCATTIRLVRTAPVSWLTSTSATSATYPLSPSYSTHATPRPLATPLRGEFGFGDGRVSQFACLAAALTTSFKRGSLRCFSRYCTGSALACAATSSKKHSCANAFCRRAGDRSGPVRNGDGTVCVNTRSLATVPVPLFFPPTRPVTYAGTALLPLSQLFGSGACARGATPAGMKPRSRPADTLPGALFPGRLPSVADLVS